MRFLPNGARTQRARPSRFVRPRLEELESRITPYVATGGAWVNPQVITISFVPDGTVLGYNGLGQAITSTLFNDFSYLGSPSVWQAQILKAAQVWAQQTNINFEVVPDDGEALGAGNYEQGNPNFGDIRISGYQQGTLLEPLAFTYLPPQLNNYSIAGDVEFNTSQPFNIGTTYDLFTVAAHEIGHALGLGESTVLNAIEYPIYTGTFTGLASDDIAGIRSIYSSGNARGPAANDHTFATAQTVSINPSSYLGEVTNGDITSTTDVDYYEFTAPTGSASTATITLQSAGLSLLAPKLYVYNASQQQLAFVNGSTEDGATLTATISITPGSTYYVKAMAGVTTAFGTGDYGVVINTGTGASPVIPSPTEEIANGSPLQSDGGELDATGAHSTASLYRLYPSGESVGPNAGQSALAVGLMQLNGQLTAFISPATTVADVVFQLNAPRTVESAQRNDPTIANGVWLQYAGGNDDVTDQVFQELDWLAEAE